MGIKDTIDKINVLKIAGSELKSAGYIIAANQVVSGINKVLSSAVKKTKNKKAQDVVESTPGKAALNFAIAAGARKLPKVGDSDPIKYISSGLRVGSIARIGNSAIEKVFKRDKKDEAKPPRNDDEARPPTKQVRVEQPTDIPDEDWKVYDK